jgi:hypothetical protein
MYFWNFGSNHQHPLLLWDQLHHYHVDQKIETHLNELFISLNPYILHNCSTCALNEADAFPLFAPFAIPTDLKENNCLYQA